jgi:catalase-peroxidase
MAMDDEEIVALIAGGHTLGKTHGAARPATSGPTPRPPIEQQGLGWTSSFGSGVGADAITSGLEVSGPRPHPVEPPVLREPVQVRVQVRSPAPSSSRPRTPREHPRPFDPARKRKPTMLVTDLTLRFDPASRRSRASS